MAIRVRVRIIRLSPRVVALDFLRCVQEMSDRQGSASRLRSDAFHVHHPQCWRHVPCVEFQWPQSLSISRSTCFSSDVREPLLAAFRRSRKS